jgi:hypothetical protein
MHRKSSSFRKGRQEKDLKTGDFKIPLFEINYLVSSRLVGPVQSWLPGFLGRGGKLPPTPLD